MLAVSLSFALLVEFAAYFLIARFVLDAAPAVAAVAAVGGLLGLRAGLCAVSWSFASAWRTPWPALRPLGFAWMVAADYAIFVFCFVVLLPLERLWMGRDRLAPCVDRLPVLLVHGYCCSRGVWWWMRRRLEAAGWTVATVKLEPVFADIDDYAASIAQRIDEVCAATGAERVLLVGHSMGGLASRAYLRRFGGGRVARLVTLGTPHQGSALARLGLGRNARQMEPGSAWLRALAREVPAVDALVLYSAHDNYVMPQALLEWPGVPRRRMVGVGHLAMLFSSRVAVALLAALETPSRASAGWKLR